MQGGDNDELPGIEIPEYLAEREAERQNEEQRIQEAQERKKKIIEGLKILGIATGIILSSYSVFILPSLLPNPNTVVEYCNFNMGRGDDWEVISLKIANKGSDESSRITVEISLPDNMTFYYADSLNNKYSRPPDNKYQEDNLLVLSWDYLLPHTSTEISQRINFVGFESTTPVYPQHIVVSAKDEHSPIYEYP